MNARRAEVARRYVRGCGIEFGALHTPLQVPPGAIVTYADLAPVEALRQSYSDVGPIRAPNITTDLESMGGIADRSQEYLGPSDRGIVIDPSPLSA